MNKKTPVLIPKEGTGAKRAMQKGDLHHFDR